MNDTEINQAAERGLAYAITFDPPTPAVADFIALLKLEPGWNDGELAEVSRLIIDRLAARAHAARFLGEASNT